MTATIKTAEKQVKALQQLQCTGINLLGRRCGTHHRDGGPTLDKTQPLEEVVIFPGLSNAFRWGKIREYGNRTNAVIMEAKDGSLFWFMAKDQDSANEKLFAKFSKTLGTIRNMPSSRTYTLNWII